MIDYSSFLSAAIQKDLNVVAYSNSSENSVGHDLLKSFAPLEEVMTHFNLQIFHIIDLFRHPEPHHPEEASIFPNYVLASNVLCFSNMEYADDEMKKSIEELMEFRTLRGIPLPNLRSVVVIYELLKEPAEIMRLQKLAPSVAIAFS